VAYLDVGVSLATSSGAQGGQIGDFIVGGSGGANKAPTWIWIAAGVIAVLALFAFLLRK